MQEILVIEAGSKYIENAVVQGLKRPFFDLSRGCSVDDIVNTSAIAAMMS